MAANVRCDERGVQLTHGKLGVGEAQGQMGRGCRLGQVILHLVLV